MKIIVLAKQVPDTRNVGANAMNANGTINRAALPTVFNPEDLKALEMALRVKDQNPGSTITVITMGPPRAESIISDSIARGADDGFVLSDPRFAASDTLATSYALSMAIKSVGQFDVVFCGRQAIDGDTAQVGPQIAEKLGVTQVTYAEELVSINSNEIVIRRRLEQGVEVVAAQLPALVTVTSSAADCRYPHFHRMIQYGKKPVEVRNADAINPEFDRLGLAGSPTKVKKIDNVVLAHKDNVTLEPTAENLNGLMRSLIDEHII